MKIAVPGGTGYAGYQGKQYPTVWDGELRSFVINVPDQGQRDLPVVSTFPMSQEPILRQSLPPGEMAELDGMRAVVVDSIRRCEREPAATGALGFTLRLLRNALNEEFPRGIDPEGLGATAGVLPDLSRLSSEERRQVEVLRALGTRLLDLIARHRRDPYLGPRFWDPFRALQGSLNNAFPPEPHPPGQTSNPETPEPREAEPAPPTAETETEQSPAGTTETCQPEQSPSETAAIVTEAEPDRTEAATACAAETVQPEAGGETQSASGAQPDATEAGQAQTETPGSETLGETEPGAEQAETGSRCSVCRLDAETRAKIAYKLGAGESLRSLAAEFNVSPSALFRHTRHAVKQEA